MHEKHMFLLTMQTFRRLLISYAILLLLPLLVSTLVYAAVISVITQEIGRANEASLMQMKRLMDSKLSGLYITADQLSLNEKVRNVAAVRQPVSPSQRLEMSGVQKLLQQYKSANAFIDEIYLYFPGSGYVLSNVSRYNGDDFAFTAQRRFGMSLTDWEEFIQAGGYRNLHMLRVKDSDTPETFILTQKLVFDGNTGNPAVLAVMADGAQLCELLDTLKWNTEGLLMLSAPDGSTLARPNIVPLPSSLDYNTLKTRHGTFQTMYMSKKCFSACIQSEVSDWQYTCLIPSDAYLQSVDFVKRLILLYVIICLAGGVILSFFMARRNYTPIYRLTRTDWEEFRDKQGQAGTVLDLRYFLLKILLTLDSLIPPKSLPNSFILREVPLLISLKSLSLSSIWDNISSYVTPSLDIISSSLLLA